MEGKRSSVPYEDQPAHWKLQLQNINEFEGNQFRRSILQEMSADFILVYMKITLNDILPPANSCHPWVTLQTQQNPLPLGLFWTLSAPRPNDILF